MKRFTTPSKFKLILFLLSLKKTDTLQDVRQKSIDKFGSCILYTKDEEYVYTFKRGKLLTYKVVKRKRSRS